MENTVSIINGEKYCGANSPSRRHEYDNGRPHEQGNMGKRRTTLSSLSLSLSLSLDVPSPVLPMAVFLCGSWQLDITIPSIVSWVSFASALNSLRSIFLFFLDDAVLITGLFFLDDVVSITGGLFVCFVGFLAVFLVARGAEWGS